MTARTHNSKRRVVIAELMFLIGTAIRPSIARSSVNAENWQSVIDRNARTDSGRLFQTDAAAARKAWLVTEGSMQDAWSNGDGDSVDASDVRIFEISNRIE